MRYDGEGNYICQKGACIGKGTPASIKERQADPEYKAKMAQHHHINLACKTTFCYGHRKGQFLLHAKKCTRCQQFITNLLTGKRVAIDPAHMTTTVLGWAKAFSPK